MFFVIFFYYKKLYIEASFLNNRILINAWEQRKLGEVAERVTRKNKNLESELPLTISAQHGLINQETFFNKKVASKDVSGYYLLKKGEFAYNKSYSSDYPWGAVKRLDNYEMGVLSTLYIVFRPNSIDSDFLAVYYDSPKWHKEVSMRAAEGARNHGLLNISPQDFFDTELMFPVNHPEQAAIGFFFQELDQLITLQQRELELMKEGKKTLLSKMFPKDGENFPEIRFLGFTDAWEQRKLGEISEKVKEKNSDNLYSIVLTNSAEFGIIPQRDFFDKDIANEKSLNGYYIVKQDDFVYNPRISNHAPVGPIKRNQLNEVGVMSPLYYVFRTHDIENSYLATYFNTTYWHKFMKLNGDSGARADRFSIKDSLFIEMPIPCPTLPEQTAIGSFFQELDQLITLQQRELEILKTMKSTLLKAMFA